MRQAIALTEAERDILERVERVPFGRFHWRLLAMGGLGYTFDAMDGAMIAFILPAVTALWKLSDGQTGWLGSSAMAPGGERAPRRHVRHKPGRAVEPVDAPHDDHALAALDRDHVLVLRILHLDSHAARQAGNDHHQELRLQHHHLSGSDPGLLLRSVPVGEARPQVDDRRYMLLGGLSAFAMSNAGSPAAITMAGVLLSFFMNGTYAGIYAYTPELYPTAFRATGMGVASAFGRIGGLSAPIVIGYTFREIGFGGVFVITTIVLAIGALAVAALGIGTAGKSLEQIAAEDRGR